MLDNIYSKEVRKVFNLDWLEPITVALATLLLDSFYIGILLLYKFYNPDSNMLNSTYFTVVIGPVTMILTILTFLLGPGIQLGYIGYNKNFLLNKSPEWLDIFAKSKVSGKAFLLRILTIFKIIAWSLLFIVPGIMAAYSYVLAPFILEENSDISVREALRRSKEMMYGNKWNLVRMQSSFIIWIIIGILTRGIFFFWILPYYNLTLTSFYLHIADENRNNSSTNDANL